MTILLSKKIRAFTLLEMLLTMAMLTIIVGVAAPVYQSLQTKNSFVVDKNTLIQSIYKAQNLAQAAKNDSDWGVHFEEGSIIVYEGSDYINRNQNFDENFKISKNNTISTDNAITFNKFSGLPESPTTVYISSLSGESLSFNLNEVGLLEYDVDEGGGGQNELFVDVNVTSDWGDGYCADVEVSTNSENIIVWEVDILLDTYPNDGVPYEVYSANWEFVDQTLTASGLDWNDTVSLSSPANFSYCADRVPEPGGGELFVDVNITSDWGSGYCADVEVSTDSEVPFIWEVDILLDTYPVNGIPSSVWSANWEFTGQTLTASGLDWNDMVSSSSPVNFGYCANR